MVRESFRFKVSRNYCSIAYESLFEKVDLAKNLFKNNFSSLLPETLNFKPETSQTFGSDNLAQNEVQQPGQHDRHGQREQPSDGDALYGAALQVFHPF